MSNFDAIIIGGGHNGLVCAAYLAKAGKKVAVLEANTQVGGAAANHEIADGYTVSSCAQFLNQLDPTIEKDLQLSKHGLEIADQNIVTTLLDNGGDHIHLNGSIATGGISEQDAAAYATLRRDVQAFVKALQPFLHAAPIDIFNADWDDKKTAIKLGLKMRFGLGKDRMRELLRVIGMNMFDWMDERMDNRLLKGGICLDACMGQFAGPRSTGTVFNYLYRDAAGEQARIAKGGMGSVTQAMAAAATALGVDIRTNSTVDSVIVENCAAVGVRLADGSELHAPIVISNADPKRTVNDIVGPRHFEADFVKGIENLRTRGVTAKLHLVLDRLPEFTDLDDSQLENRMVIAPTPRAVERAFDHAKYGEVSAEPMMEIHIPSIKDSSLAPSGKHILSATVQYAPYSLKDGWNEGARMNFQKACIDRIAQFAPDIHKSIIKAELMTPADIESRYGLTGGHWHQGEMALDQILMMRPTPGAARFALPLDGMYLCGAGAHPGGGVMGMAGKLAAKTVLKGEK